MWHTVIWAGEEVLLLFSFNWPLNSALCPRLWWISSTQAWGTWSISGRAMRNQLQVNAVYILLTPGTHFQDESRWAIKLQNVNSELGLGHLAQSFSSLLTCVSSPPAAMTLAGKAYFEAVSKVGENAMVSPVSRELGEFHARLGHICWQHLIEISREGGGQPEISALPFLF